MATATRASRLCPGTRVACPTCGAPVLFMSARNGDAFHKCRAKRGQGDDRHTCGQHFYVYCTARLCTVVAVTREERDHFEQDQSTPEEILTSLGLNVAREAA